MNTHTARARAAAQRDYLACTERTGRDDMATWVLDMQARGLSANTIRQRAYLARAWLAAETAVALPARQTIHEGKWLDVEQARALLSVVPKNAMGRRDFALLVALLITGLRLGQVRTWRWDEIRSPGGRFVLQNQALPGVVLEALQAAREDSHSGNMDLRVDIRAAPYIFAALVNRRCVGLCVGPSQQSTTAPLSPQEINRHIGRYARLAGLEPQGITAECLRRTRRELGERVVTTLAQEMLDARRAHPVRWKRVNHDPRLHGIGRRSL